MSRMENFILDHGECDTYAEPRVQLHDDITFQVAEEIAKLIPDDGKILDVGCGQGPALEWFTKNGFQIHGISTNADDLIECGKRGFISWNYDQNHLPLMWTGTYDLAWARHVLEHSIAPFWTLTEISRILKTGGILYAEVPAPDTTSEHEQNANHYAVMGWKMWASLLTRAGFEIVHAAQRPLVTLLGADLYLSFTARKI